MPLVSILTISFCASRISAFCLPQEHTDWWGQKNAAQALLVIFVKPRRIIQLCGSCSCFMLNNIHLHFATYRKQLMTLYPCSIWLFSVKPTTHFLILMYALCVYRVVSVFIPGFNIISRRRLIRINRQFTQVCLIHCICQVYDHSS